MGGDRGAKATQQAQAPGTAHAGAPASPAPGSAAPRPRPRAQPPQPTCMPKMRCRREKVRGSWASAAPASRAATASLLLSRRCCCSAASSICGVACTGAGGHRRRQGGKRTYVQPRALAECCQPPRLAQRPPVQGLLSPFSLRFPQHRPTEAPAAPHSVHARPKPRALPPRLTRRVSSEMIPSVDMRRSCSGMEASRSASSWDSSRSAPPNSSSPAPARLAASAACAGCACCSACSACCCSCCEAASSWRDSLSRGMPLPAERPHPPAAAAGSAPAAAAAAAAASLPPNDRRRCIRRWRSTVLGCTGGRPARPAGQEASEQIG